MKKEKNILLLAMVLNLIVATIKLVSGIMFGYGMIENIANFIIGIILFLLFVCILVNSFGTHEVNLTWEIFIILIGAYYNLYLTIELETNVTLKQLFSLENKVKKDIKV